MTVRARMKPLAALAAASLLTAPALAQHGAMVAVDEARQETVEQWRQVTGNLRALQRTLLAAEEEGLVVALAKREGDPVAAGEVVAKLDDKRAAIDVQRARAAVSAARAVLAQRRADAERAQRDLARVEGLIARGSAAEAELDERRTLAQTAAAAVEEAQADLAEAETALALSEERLEDMTIEAPFAGRVVQRRTEVGQWLQRGDAIVEVVDLDNIEAWLDVPERFIDRLSSADAVVQVRVPALGETFQAPVTSIIPDADPVSRLFPVRVRLENAKGRLRPGMSAVGLVPTGTPAPTLTVPKDAILRDDAGEFLYMNAGGTAAVARVETLFATGPGRVAVRSATLQPGAQVVIEGNERLFPGQPLMIVRDAAAGPASPSSAPAPQDPAADAAPPAEKGR